jgi:hypothetical protein
VIIKGNDTDLIISAQVSIRVITANIRAFDIQSPGLSVVLLHSLGINPTGASIFPTCLAVS